MTTEPKEGKLKVERKSKVKWADLRRTEKTPEKVSKEAKERDEKVKKAYEAIVDAVYAEIFTKIRNTTLKQKEFASLMGVNRTHLSRRMAWKQPISLKTLARFAVALDCDVEIVFRDKLSAASFFDETTVADDDGDWDLTVVND